MAVFKTSLEFITSLENHPVLYNSTLQEYHKREARRQALKEICSDVGLPIGEDSIKLIINKIKQLRSTFSKELKSFNGSKNSGAGTDDLEEPTWKWFKPLKFLIPHVKVRCGKNNIRDTVPMNYTTAEAPTDDVPVVATKEATEEALLSEHTFDTESESLEPIPVSVASTSNGIGASGTKRTHQFLSPRPNKARRLPSTQESSQWTETKQLIKTMVEKRQANKSKHYHFCMDMCGQLDSLSDETAVLVKKHISDLLFHFATYGGI